MMICLAGPRASGKSTTAKFLGNLLGWSVFSFGDFLRDLACQNGLDSENLLVLQDLGLKMINQGWDFFCQSFLTFYDYNGDNAVIEGIRHVEAVTTLAKLTNKPVFLVYLDIDEHTQNVRVLSRNRGEYHGHSSHTVEQHVEGEVKNAADCIINSNVSTEIVVKSIIDTLPELGAWITYSNTRDH